MNKITYAIQQETKITPHFEMWAWVEEEEVSSYNRQKEEIRVKEWRTPTAPSCMCKRLDDLSDQVDLQKISFIERHYISCCKDKHLPSEQLFKKFKDCFKQDLFEYVVRKWWFPLMSDFIITEFKLYYVTEQGNKLAVYLIPSECMEGDITNGDRVMFITTYFDIYKYTIGTVMSIDIDNSKCIIDIDNARVESVPLNFVRKLNEE